MIMTDKKNSADQVHDHTTTDDSPHAHQAPDRRGWVAAILHRWPTWLAIAMAVLHGESTFCMARSSNTA